MPPISNRRVASGSERLLSTVFQRPNFRTYDFSTRIHENLAWLKHFEIPNT